MTGTLINNNGSILSASIGDIVQNGDSWTWTTPTLCEGDGQTVTLSIAGNCTSVQTLSFDVVIIPVVGSICDLAPCTGDLTFSSQAEVNAFPANCAIINGNLIINGDDITDLSNLLSIQQVTGSVIIGDTVQGVVGNDLLTNLEGLNNIETIDSNLIICQNPVLESLSGFSSLAEVGGDIVVKNCDSLDSFTLIVLNGVGGNITLSGLPLLVEVGPFNFTQHNGSIVIDGTGLVGLGGFSGLLGIGGDLFIQNNPNLTELNLQNLIDLGGCLHIINNVLVVDLSGLGNIQTIGGDIRIIDNDLIQNVDDLGSLTSINGSLVISENDLLANLDSLANLLQVLDSLVVTNNPNLSACCGLFPLLSGANAPNVIIIENNLAVCNSVAEILTNCPPDTTWYADADNDGFGDPNSSIQSATQPAGYVDNNDDCDDTNADVNPTATEICDGLDNNCDGQIDEGLFVDYFPDFDLDGFGDNSASPNSSCFPISGFVTNNEDCDDTNDDINPTASEVCDGIDNNCDGIIDPPGCGGIPDCANIGIDTSGNDLIITGLDLADISFVQVFDANWNTLFQCFANCGSTLTQTYPNGTYYVFAKYFDSNYQQLCEVLKTVVINGSMPQPPPPCFDLEYVASANQLTVNNIDTTYFMEFQIFDIGWDSVYYCFKDCGPSFTIPLPSNSYQLLIKYFNQNYNVVCERLDTVFVSDNLIANGSQFKFEAIKHEEHVEILWVHTDGIHTESYVLQKSKDGHVFDDISTVPSERKNGPDLYETYDLEPMEGDNFYRLKIIGDNQQATFSEVKKVFFPTFDPFTIFPNPANNFAKIDLSRQIGKTARIKIVNNLGVPVKQFDLENIYSKYYQMDLRELNEGHYIVWVFVENHKPVTGKLVIGKR